MKPISALLASSAALALVIRTAEARQMHANINYERHLQEADFVEKELDAWMDKFGEDGEKYEWIPMPESRDADEVLDDHFGPNAKPTKEIGLDGSSVDWSTDKPCMAPVQTQGRCASCWAFATVAATEFGQCVSTKAKSFVKVSEQQVTTCDTSNSGCRSGWPAKAFDYIKQNGVCSGSDIPYTMQNGNQVNCRTDCKRITNNLKGWSRVKGEDGLIEAPKKQPVVVAVAATNSVWKQYKGGVISSCATTQLDHAVLAVGFDKTSIKVRNSWCLSWGEGGYVRIKRIGSNGVCGLYEDMVHANF